MPECRDDDCICGHPPEMHDQKTLCMFSTCSCMEYHECHAGQMFVAKLKKGFRFQITGRGMAPHAMTESEIRSYLQMMLAYADKNIMHKLNDDEKPKNLIFDMITSVDDY